MMETPKEKVKEILENVDLEKQSKFSYQNSSSKTYKGRITWSLKESDLNVESFGFSKECSISVGSPDFCKMKLRIFPKGKTENASNFVSIDNIFQTKLPKGSYFYSALSLVNKEGEAVKYRVETNEGKDVEIINFDDFVPIRMLQEILNEEKQITIVLFLKITCSTYVSHSDGTECSVNDSYVMKLPIKKCIERMPSDLKIIIQKEELQANKALISTSLPAFQFYCKGVPDAKELKMPKRLSHMNIDMFKRIMDFALTENVTFLNFSDACRLYDAAATFQMNKLLDVSAAYLGGNLSKKNLFLVETLAQKSKNVPLLEACIDFVKSCDTEELAHESLLG